MLLCSITHSFRYHYSDWPTPAILLILWYVIPATCIHRVYRNNNSYINYYYYYVFLILLLLLLLLLCKSTISNTDILF